VGASLTATEGGMGAAGYSGTRLPRKLGIKPGATVAWSGAPAGFDRTLGDLPADVTVRSRVRGPLDVVVVFARRRTELVRRFDGARRALTPAGGLWVAWPKKSSGVATDLTFETVQRLGLDTGLVDNKVCAIDDTWSALRFVHRVADRPSGHRG
jgi:hypothetical protein